jgi:hypothetical protein
MVAAGNRDASVVAPMWRRRLVGDVYDYRTSPAIVTTDPSG